MNRFSGFEKFIETIPLWRYTDAELGEPVTLLDIDFGSVLRNEFEWEGHSGTLTTRSRSANAVVIWVDFILDDETVLSYGPGKAYSEKGVWHVSEKIEKEVTVELTFGGGMIQLMRL